MCKNINYSECWSVSLLRPGVITRPPPYRIFSQFCMQSISLFNLDIVLVTMIALVWFEMDSKVLLLLLITFLIWMNQNKTECQLRTHQQCYWYSYSVFLLLLFLTSFRYLSIIDILIITKISIFWYLSIFDIIDNFDNYQLSIIKLIDNDKIIYR